MDADLTTLQTRMESDDQAVNELYYATIIDLFEECSTNEWLSFCAKLLIDTIHEQIFETVRSDVVRDQTIS